MLCCQSRLWTVELEEHILPLDFCLEYTQGSPFPFGEGHKSTNTSIYLAGLSLRGRKKLKNAGQLQLSKCLGKALNYEQD